MKLEVKRATVIDSAMGVGLEIARLLVEANAQVLVSFRDSKRIRSYGWHAKEIREGKGFREGVRYAG